MSSLSRRRRDAGWWPWTGRGQFHPVRIGAPTTPTAIEARIDASAACVAAAGGALAHRPRFRYQRR
jgi:hypothetical protein